MSSLFKRNGRYFIDLYKRGRLAVGPEKSIAVAVHRHVDALEQAQKFAVDPPEATRIWLQKIDPAVADRLASLSLIDRVDASIETLCEDFKATKPSLHSMYGYTADALVSYFNGRPVHEISPGDAQSFRAHLLKDLAPTTAARRFKAAREIFKFAKAKRLIAENPFEGIKAGPQSNESRTAFIDRETADRVMRELSDEDKRIFALGRYGGLRLPSEAAGLLWSDVDLEERSIVVRAGKTRSRKLPLFAELAPYLPGGDGPACPVLAGKANPRAWIVKRLTAAIKRAGVETWPRLLHNLRASRATEVAREFGGKAESSWLGHGETVALRHYLSVTDDQWRRAVESPTASR